MRGILLIVLFWTLGHGGCGSTPRTPLETVASVDLTRYAGRWYEIASYPAVFQIGCVGTTADYSLNDDGTVKVINTCDTLVLGGPQQSVEGRARVVDSSTNAKFKVSFSSFGSSEGDYWIIDLDTEDYQWAVVGEPSRTFLWILSRTRTLDDAIYEEILARLPEKGYDARILEKTRQTVGQRLD